MIRINRVDEVQAWEDMATPDGALEVLKRAESQYYLRGDNDEKKPAVNDWQHSDDMATPDDALENLKKHEANYYLL